MKKFVAVLMSACMLAAFAGCGNSAGSGKTFTVGFDKEFPPMGFVDNDGSYVGFDLDLAAEVASRLKMELKLQPIDWNSKNMELDSGNIDCVWNGFTINGREAEYTWTQPYMNNNQIVVVREDSTVNSFADLAGQTIGVQDDSSALSAIEGNETFSSSIGKLVKTTTNMNALMELESGAVAAVVMDECVARYNIQQDGKFRVLDEVVGAEEFGVGFKLGNEELRDKVEEQLIAMAKDGKLAEISEKWFDKDITTIGK